jgi:cyclopropane-fatty-acyl-phospholipid synthase
MSLAELAGRAADRMDLPDFVMAAGISTLVGRTRRKLAVLDNAEEAAFVRGLEAFPIAIDTEAANAQHYELPPEFFGQVLGPRRKYSSCFYDGSASLAEAEERALAETCAHAGLADGQRILELGCGWGSLSLWMAERYPAARIVAVSNSAPQRGYIEGQARARGLGNLTVITADMNVFAPEGVFDRVVSVEMFEHMSNWRSLLGRIRGWLAPEGRLFLHVFSHRRMPYRFHTEDKADWIAQYFFTGGIMPSHGMMRHFGDLFEVEQDWRWNGGHYERTALDWLRNFDSDPEAIARILRPVYGAETKMWTRRWRIFFLATAGLFGFSRGQEWGVSHWRLAPSG